MHLLGVDWKYISRCINTWSNNFATLQLDKMESIMRAILDFIAVFNHYVLQQFFINFDMVLIASSWLNLHFGSEINGTFGGPFQCHQCTVGQNPWKPFLSIKPSECIKKLWQPEFCV